MLYNPVSSNSVSLNSRLARTLIRATKKSAVWSYVKFFAYLKLG